MEWDSKLKLAIPSELMEEFHHKDNLLLQSSILQWNFADIFNIVDEFSFLWIEDDYAIFQHVRTYYVLFAGRETVIFTLANARKILCHYAWP